MNYFLWTLSWILGYAGTVKYYMVNLKRDYRYGHKTWVEFMFYLGRLPGVSKFVLAIELVFMFNFLFVAWPIYWAIKIIERIWPND